MVGPPTIKKPRVNSPHGVFPKMRTMLVAVAGVLLLAGCAGGGPVEPRSLDSGPPASASGGPSDEPGGGEEAAPPPPEEVTDTGPKALHFDNTFSLTVTHVHLPGSGTNPGLSQTRINQDPNCVGFGKDQVWLILNGTAEATWSNPGPFASKMTVDIRDVALMATNNGSVSPAVLEFGRFQTVPNALLGLWFIVQPTDAGVVAQQAVTLRISFNYLGVPDLKTVVEPCVYTTTFQEDQVRNEVST